jgi:hypothetical protein
MERRRFGPSLAADGLVELLIVAVDDDEARVARGGRGATSAD